MPPDLHGAPTARNGGRGAALARCTRLGLSAEFTAAILAPALFAELHAIAESLVRAGVSDDYVEIRGRRVWRKHGLRSATELVARLIRERDHLRDELHQRFGAQIVSELALAVESLARGEAT